jgi:hypothetical protein
VEENLTIGGSSDSGGRLFGDSLLAVLADAEDGEVVEAGMEAILIGEGGGEG